MKTCSTCRFWMRGYRGLNGEFIPREPDQDQFKKGECRCSSPVVAGIGLHSVWPSSSENDGCGMWWEHENIESEGNLNVEDGGRS